MRTLGVLLLLALSVTAAAYQPDYFPLQPGNQWIYVQDGVSAGEPITIVVDSFEVFDQKAYALVTGFPSGDAWLHLGDDGVLMAWDQATQSESPWVAFGAPEGEPFRSAITPCNDSGLVTSRAASIEGPVGEFHHALEVVYTSTCADAGIVTDFFLPHVGLLHRVETTIAGPRTWDLVYARLGGVTFVSEPSVSFSLALHWSDFTYSGGSGIEQVYLLRARLTLRNHFVEPLTLTFPSSQRFDLTVTDESGRLVYRWSDGKGFAEVLSRETLSHGEKNYVIGIPAFLGTGRYKVEAWLTTDHPREYSASAVVEVPGSDRDPDGPDPTLP